MNSTLRDKLIAEIAKAIFDVRDDEFDTDEWEDLDSTDRERYECDARAVLPVVERLVAEAKADPLDQIIDRYFRGEANRFSLNKNVLDWIRAQPEYLMRYPREALAVGQEGENDE